MNPPTLYLTGALCPRALNARIRNAGPSDIVLEFDTLLDPNCYPNVGHWINSYDLFESGLVSNLRKKTYKLIQAYITLGDTPEDRPGDQELRRAGITPTIQDSIFSYLWNSYLYQYVSSVASFERIVALAGSGVNFGFWRDIALTHGLEIEIIHPERFCRGLARWWEKKRFKRLARAKAKLAAQSRNSVENLRPDSKLPWVFCASKRVARLLTLEEAPADFRIKQLDWRNLEQPDQALVSAEARRLSNCLQNWLAGFRGGISNSAQDDLCQFTQKHGAALLSINETLLARWSVMRDNAMESLKIERPRLLLTDTQIAEEEIIWSLAARTLDIPVVAYNYDFVVNTQTDFVPDHLLAAGMYAIPRALTNGYSSNKIINVRSHVRPTNAPRSSIEDEAVYGAPHPVILFADPGFDSRLSARCYRVVIEAARVLPSLRFVIKFHPLRGLKTEERSFNSNCETEIAKRLRFIKSQSPSSNVSYLAPEASMAECLKSTAVLLNANSMSGHEAFHLGVPVIFLYQQGRDAEIFPELAERMSPLYANDANTLVLHLNHLLGDANARKLYVAAQHRYIDDFYWPSKKTINEAISDLLGDQIGQSSSPGV